MNVCLFLFRRSLRVNRGKKRLQLKAKDVGLRRNNKKKRSRHLNHNNNLNVHNVNLI